MVVIGIEQALGSDQPLPHDGTTLRLVETLHRSRLTGTLALQQQLGDALRTVLHDGLAATGRTGRLSPLDNHEVAERVHVSVHMVKFHIGTLLRRYGARTRTELVRVLMERHLI